MNRGPHGKRCAVPNTGLTDQPLNDVMDLRGDMFVAEGIPLTPYNDANPDVEVPYQVAEVIIRDTGGTELTRGLSGSSGQCREELRHDRSRRKRRVHSSAASRPDVSAAERMAWLIAHQPRVTEYRILLVAHFLNCSTLPC